MRGHLLGKEAALFRTGGESMLAVVCCFRPSALLEMLQLCMGLSNVGVELVQGLDVDAFEGPPPFLLFLSAFAWLAAADIRLLASSARLRL